MARVIIYAVLCALVGFFAYRKGRSALTWSLAALLVTPLISSVVLAFLPPAPVRRIEPPAPKKPFDDKTIDGEFKEETL